MAEFHSHVSQDLVDKCIKKCEFAHRFGGMAKCQDECINMERFKQCMFHNQDKEVCAKRLLDDVKNLEKTDD